MESESIFHLARIKVKVSLNILEMETLFFCGAVVLNWTMDYSFQIMFEVFFSFGKCFSPWTSEHEGVFTFVKFLSTWNGEVFVLWSSVLI